MIAALLFCGCKQSRKISKSGGSLNSELIDSVMSVLRGVNW